MQPSDARSDIYAVGVIAYHLLTGRKPHGMAKPPSQLKPGLDPRWDQFVATCLAEDPAQRYQTANAAQEALEQLLKPVEKKRSPALMIAGAAVLVAGGIAAALFWPREKPAAAEEKAAAPVAVATPNVAERKELAPVEVKPVAPTNRAFALTGLPVGAVVTFRERNYPVSAGGRVTLELPPGGQMVNVRAPGYQNWEGVVGGTEGETEVQIPIERLPPRAIKFTGLPAGAEVTAGDQVARSDGNGVAVLQLHLGAATVTARAPKFQTLELPVDIRESTETFAMEMSRVPPPAEITVALPDGGELKLRWVAAGEFQAGSPADERGRQRNDLTRARAEIAQGFYIATTEMTQRQHRALTGKNPSTSRALGDENRPVEQVAWRDIMGTGGVLEKSNDLLRKLNLPFKADLPTEIEWEYACRAGTESAFNDGSNLTHDRDDPALSALGNYARGGSQTAPAPVGRLKPNRWGLYDMHGNVGEWAHGSRGPREPVLRGGNWKVGPALCRSASRTELTPETRPTDAMGYRLVLRPTEL